MAHQMEPMDIDSSVCDFDDKENAFHHNKVLSGTPSTEKGYEELDVSELNMKLRYSITPLNSPMSKSYTANCNDNINSNLENQNNSENGNMTKSLHSTLNKNDSSLKTQKILPLQVISGDQGQLDGNRNALRAIDSATDCPPIVTVISPNDEDEDMNISIPSSSSSLAPTPEATTPTKETPRDGGSPIMRGLKSVLNMFRPSQSPIPPEETAKTEVLSPPIVISPIGADEPRSATASTPLAAQKTKDPLSKSNNRGSLVFNEDLTTELQWKDETTIFFSNEKIPIHKLFYQQTKPKADTEIASEAVAAQDINDTAEYMDISNNESGFMDKTITAANTHTGTIGTSEAVNNIESDSEFVDCESSMRNESILDSFKSPVKDTYDSEMLNATLKTLNLSQNDSQCSDKAATVLSDQLQSETENRALQKPFTEGDLIKMENIPSMTPVQDEIKKECLVVPKNVVKDDSSAKSDTTFELKQEGEKQNPTPNNVVSTIAQIPLIVDPRILLFNVPPDAENEHLNFNKSAVQVPSANDDESEFNLQQAEEINSRENHNISTCNDNYYDEQPKSNNIQDNKVTESKTTEIPILSSHEISTFFNTTNFETFSNITQSHIDGDVIENIDTLIKEMSSDNNSVSDLVNSIEIKSSNGQMISEVAINTEITHIPAIVSGVKLETLDVKDLTINPNELQLMSDEAMKASNETINNIPLDNDSKLSDNEKLISESFVKDIKQEVDIIVATALDIVTSNSNLKTASVINHTANDETYKETNIGEDNQNLVETKDTLEIFTENAENNNTSIEEKNKVNQLTESKVESSDNTVDFPAGNCYDNNAGPDKIEFNLIAEDKDVVKIASQEPDDSNLETRESDNTVINIENLDKEIMASKNNSPFVSISTEIGYASEMDIHNKNSEKLSLKSNSNPSPPLSPKIVSRGYNLNFDEIEDPFNTLTTIRASPTPESASPLKIKPKKEHSPKKHNKNSFKTQLNKRNKILDSTFDNTDCCDIKQSDISGELLKTIKTENLAKCKDVSSLVLDGTFLMEKNAPNESLDTKQLTNEESAVVLPVSSEEIISMQTDKVCSNIDNTLLIEGTLQATDDQKCTTTEQSTCSAVENVSNKYLKQTFDLPVFDDPTFNPFTSKSKICQTPPPDVNCDHPTKIVENEPVITNPNINDNTKPSINIDERNQTQVMGTIAIESDETTDTDIDHKNENITQILEEKHTSNTSNDSIKTEDADTLEGPFLEADLNYDDKMSDVEDNINEVLCDNKDQTEPGELFIDAEAFEYLLNQNQPNTIIDSGKESLFLKFDPLYAKRMSSNGVLAVLNKVQNNESAKNTDNEQSDLILNSSPVPGPSKLNVTQDVDISNAAEDSFDDLNVTVSKPMMVVNPVNPTVTLRNKPITPVRTNRPSLSLVTSPAIDVVDRLLCLSANNSLLQDYTLVENRRNNEIDLALIQLREALADKEISVYNLRSESEELKDRLAKLESQMKSLESISEMRLKKINDLNEQLNEKTNINRSMKKVVEEYEKTIGSLISEIEQDKIRHAEEREQLMKERDEQTAHLANIEASFSDLHSKYEKSKQTIYAFKANEDKLKNSIKEFEDNLIKMQNNYELLKQHATSKINCANEELQKINRSHDAEVFKLNALIKRKELHITSLEETLQQKTKANEELTAICDELINKVG